MINVRLFGSLRIESTVDTLALQPEGVDFVGVEVTAQGKRLAGFGWRQHPRDAARISAPVLQDLFRLHPPHGRAAYGRHADQRGKAKGHQLTMG